MKFLEQKDKDIINESNLKEQNQNTFSWKFLQTAFLPLCHTCQSLKKNFFWMVASTTAQYFAPLPYHGSNQIKLRPGSYAKVLCIRKSSYACSQNLPHFQRQHWREPISATGLVCAKECWESNKVAKDGLNIGQKKQATVNDITVISYHWNASFWLFVHNTLLIPTVINKERWHLEGVLPVPVGIG